MFLTTIAAKWAARKVIVGTIFRSWLTYVCIAVFAAFVALWLHDRHLYDQIHNTEDGYITQIAQVDLRVSHCKANNVGLVDAIAKQNAAILLLKSKGDDLQLTAEQQAAKIVELERQKNVWINSFEDDVVGQSCDEAMSWMLQKAIEGGSQ